MYFQGFPIKIHPDRNDLTTTTRATTTKVITTTRSQQSYRCYDDIGKLTSVWGNATYKRLVYYWT